MPRMYCSGCMNLCPECEHLYPKDEENRIRVLTWMLKSKADDAQWGTVKSLIDELYNYVNDTSQYQETD